MQTLPSSNSSRIALTSSLADIAWRSAAPQRLWSPLESAAVRVAEITACAAAISTSLLLRTNSPVDCRPWLSISPMAAWYVPAAISVMAVAINTIATAAQVRQRKFTQAAEESVLIRSGPDLVFPRIGASQDAAAGPQNGAVAAHSASTIGRRDCSRRRKK